VAITLPVVWLAAGFLLADGYSLHDVILVAALLTASASVAVAASVHAVHAAVRGRPEVIAGLTALPNTGAALLVVMPTSAPIALMCVGLLVGNAVTYRLARARAQSAADAQPSQPKGGAAGEAIARSSTGGLLMASTIGATGPFALQAATATYAAGQATILGFASKLGNGLVGVGVTSFTNVATDWHRRSVRPLQLAARRFAAGQLLLLVCLGVVLLADGDQILMTVLAASAWVLAAASQACSDRALGMLGRLVVFRRAAVAGVLLYAAATVGLILGPHSALSYFIALTLISTVANLIFLVGLGWRRERDMFLASLPMFTLLFGAAVVVRHV
jgi:hypothetical protein